ncbi:hypothetical protein DMA11_03390 [Marinilabiliaceae bacterium JC017]|nr:hypothetical protein DMA11_03390 [Marinilabiliaceae bacterium JC017]
MKYVIYIVIAFIFWLLITSSVSPAILLTGTIVALLTVGLLGRYFVDDVYRLFQLRRYYWFVIYLFIFIWECLKANFDVAYRVLHPDLPIKPGIVKVKTYLKTNIGRTTLANSITMTPGTITVDIIEDYIYVHWIYVSTTDPERYTEKIAGRFEKYIKRIFE